MMAGGISYPCAEPGCGVASPERYCERHRKQRRGTTQRGNSARGGRAYGAEALESIARVAGTRVSAARRGYGRRWQRLRLVVLKRDPVCRACGREASTDVDHILPKRAGGPDSLENLQGLCGPCHSRKTASGR